MNELKKLYTEDGEKLQGIPHSEYPRPHMVRDSFFCLNGEWEYGTSHSGSEQYGKKILVPFCPGSLLSGIDEVPPEDHFLWYKRSFRLPEGFKKDRVLLHFGAVDAECEVFLNDVKIGSHRGGYHHFSFDITKELAEENMLKLKVWDRLGKRVLPYGKQRYDRGGMWYTPVCGIWQSVWMESVPEKYIKGLRCDTDGDSVRISVSGIEDGELILLEDKNELRFPVKNGEAAFILPSPRHWSPEDPYLYRFKVNAGDDSVSSYFALRSLEIKEVKGLKLLCLNGKPYFFHGVLDQGYWSDGIFTPASEKGFEKDILTMKSLGFNMLRKHIKTEPDIFYYYCDLHGMAVFQDMVNNGDYSFFRDTALPTIGITKLSDKNMHKDPETRKAFLEGMEQTAEQLRCFPSVCCYTIFNEGWGQFCGSEAYRKLKALDPTRPIDTASGWFSGCETDFDSRHIYFKKLKAKYSGKPLFISEFGGYSYKAEGHVANKKKSYGYGKTESTEEFEKALIKLYEELIPLKKEGLSASVYTQLSDVEDEINGLITYDRKFLKINPESFLPISNKLKGED